MKFAIYSRKSVYTGKGESIENQITLCKDYIYAKFQNAGIEDIEVYTDEGFSGKDTDRPQFQKLLQDARTKKFSYIVCYRLDRVSRSVSDFSALIEELNRLSVSFICIREEFDTSTPMGKAMMYIASVFAQLERETIAERVRDNMLMLARTGRWLGGGVPLGYSGEKEEEPEMAGKAKSACWLKINQNEIGTARLIYDKYMELQSVSGVVKALYALGVKTRSNQYYSSLGVKDILRNPVYAIACKEIRDYFLDCGAEVCFEEKDCKNNYGLTAYNKRDYTAKGAPRQEKSQWIVALGRHRGIIAGKQWIKVQNQLDANKNKSLGQWTNQDNRYALLSGVLTCKKCGSKMYSKLHSPNKDGRFYYLCYNKMRYTSAACACANLPGAETDETVCRYLLGYSNENPMVISLLEELKIEIRLASHSTSQDDINSQIKKCQKEMENLVSAAGKKGLSDLFLQKLDEKITLLNDKLESLKIQQKQYAPDDGGHLLPVHFKEDFSLLSIQEKREFIRIMAQKIEWDGENLHIYINHQKT